MEFKIIISGNEDYGRLLRNFSSGRCIDNRKAYLVAHATRRFEAYALVCEVYSHRDSCEIAVAYEVASSVEVQKPEISAEFFFLGRGVGVETHLMD